MNKYKRAAFVKSTKMEQNGENIDKDQCRI